MIAGSLDLVITVCPAWAKHHAGGFTCPLHMGCPTTQRNSWGSEKAIHCLCEAASHTRTVPLQTRPCHVACSDFWLLKQYSLLKYGQCWEPGTGIFFLDTLGIEWAVCVQPGLGAGSFLGL